MMKKNLSIMTFVLAFLTVPLLHAETKTTVETTQSDPAKKSATGSTTTVETNSPVTIKPSGAGTTTVETSSANAGTTTSTTSTTTKAGKKGPVTSTSVTTTETVVPHAVYDQKTLQKLADAAALCTKGFDSHVGSNDKNVCQSKAQSPDIAYTCSWKEKGPAVFTETAQGPCTLDFAEHKGGMIISKEDYKSSPPLSYGTAVECCYRPASGVAKTESVNVVGAK